MTQLATTPAGLKGDWEWLLTAAATPAKALAPVTGLATGLVVGGRWLFKGISCQNTATAAGQVKVINGQDQSGEGVYYLAVAASGIGNSGYLHAGILCDIGIYVVVTGLAGALTIWATPLSDYPFTPPGE